MATEKHSLILEVDSRAVKQGEKDLNSLTNSAGKAEGSTNKLSSSFGNAARTAIQFGSAVAGISLLGLGSVSLVAADNLNRLDGRLKLATDSMEEFVSQQKQLYKIAIDTHVPLQDITTLFIKLDPALKQLGANTEAVNKTVETFAKGLKLGGASAEESSSAILQFSQAMGSGVLRGEEFNAMMEASPYLMRKLADGMNVPVNSLRKMAEAGELTAGRVSAALLKMSGDIDGEFKQSYYGMSEAMVDFKNEASLFAQELDKSTGFTSMLSGALKDAGVALRDGKNAIGETIQTLEEYEVLIKGVATALIVMYGAQKAAVLWETALQAIRAKSVITTTAYNAVLMRTVTTQTTLTTAQTLGAIASRGLGLALKAIPFVAVASTVAILATSFFDAKKQSDDLNESLNDTAETLAKLGAAQLSYKRQNLSLALQETGLELRRLKQEYGATSKQTLEQRKEIEDLTRSYNDQKEAAKLLAQAQTNLRNKPTATAQKKENKPQTIETIITKLESDTPKTDKPKKEKKTEAQKESEQLQKDIEKARLDAIQDNADRETEIYLGGYQAQLDAAQFNIDQITQMEIDKYNAIEQAAQDSADRQASNALALYESTLSEQDKINEKNLEILNSAGEFFNEDQLTNFFSKWQESIDGVQGGYSDIMSEIDGLNSGSKDWTTGFDGQAKQIANIVSAYADITDNTKKYDKLRKKVDKSQLTDDQKKVAYKELEEEQLYAQIGAYSNLAGAMASAFEEGSAGAIAFTALQSALGIASSWAAIAEAWALGFPQNIPAVAAVTAAVMPIIAQLGGSGGGGGGAVKGGQKGVDYEANKSFIEESYTPVTDRLDRQISLLESIDKQGSASALGVVASSVSFERDVQKWVQDVLSQSVQGAYVGAPYNEIQAQEMADKFNQSFGSKLYTVKGDNLFVDYSKLQSSSDVINALITSINTGVAGVFGLLEDYKKIKYESQERKLVRVVSELNDLQNIIGDWAEGILSSMDDLKSASKDFKTYFDDITGTAYYETLRLEQAYSEVDKLRGENSFADYLKNTITDIDGLQTFFTNDTFSLLMSNNLADIEKQMEALERLSDLTGQTFAGGAQEALDYLESIQLVSEDMANARDVFDELSSEINDFVSELRSELIQNDTVGTFKTFSESFDNMIDSIASGASNIGDIGNKAIEDAKAYLEAIKGSADTKQRDIAFAKAVIANKFESVVLTPDVSMSTINDTLRFNHEALIAEQIRQNQKLNDIIRVLNESRDISNSSLVTLQTIEAVS